MRTADILNIQEVWNQFLRRNQKVTRTAALLNLLHNVSQHTGRQRCRVHGDAASTATPRPRRRRVHGDAAFTARRKRRGRRRGVQVTLGRPQLVSEEPGDSASDRF
ncbi:uncharacterized protein V6R79_002627 [Siganus canaliculatus]